MSVVTGDKTDLTVPNPAVTPGDDEITNGTLDYIAHRHKEFLRPDTVPHNQFQRANEFLVQ